MKLSSLRSLLYMLARLLGDYEAVRKGRTGRRLTRRLAGRGTAKILRSLFK